jgi:RNA polymerase sigma-70 factor (ECF subfamily)
VSTFGPPGASLKVSERGSSLIVEIAIREFLHTAYPRLVAAVTLVTGSRPVAEDAVHEALAKAWERSERGLQIESLSAWVTTVSFNLARSWLRRMAAERRARSRLGTRPPVQHGVDERLDVRDALAALPRRQREATVLRYYLGMNVKEIAQVLATKEGTAKTTLFRARKALSEALGEPDLEEANDRGEA